MWQTLLQRQPWRGQLINQRRDGGLYLVDIDITPVLNPQGELEHYLAMQRDISVSYTGTAAAQSYDANGSGAQ